MLVHDRQDDNRYRSFAKENTKRERLREAAAYIKLDDRIEAWIETDAVNGILNRRQESPTEVWLLCFVVCRCRSHFSFCFGVESDGLHFNAA